MNADQLRELDAWISEHVMRLKPVMLAVALNANESGMALWETAVITKDNLRSFCEKHPQYHYKEVPQCANFTTDSYAAMTVLKKCMEVVAITLGTEKDDVKSCSDKSGIFGMCEAETLELAICLFAKKLFSK